jgi:hypothetical protein
LFPADLADNGDFLDFDNEFKRDKIKTAQSAQSAGKERYNFVTRRFSR